jgi:hypothetical protein
VGGDSCDHSAAVAHCLMGVGSTKGQRLSVGSQHTRHSVSAWGRMMNWGMFRGRNEAQAASYSAGTACTEVRYGAQPSKQLDWFQVTRIPQHPHAALCPAALLPAVHLCLCCMQLARAGAMEDVFALCYGFPDGGSMLLGRSDAAEKLDAVMQLQGSAVMCTAHCAHQPACNSAAVGLASPCARSAASCATAACQHGYLEQLVWLLSSQ